MEAQAEAFELRAKLFLHGGFYFQMNKQSTEWNFLHSRTVTARAVQM